MGRVLQRTAPAWAGEGALDGLAEALLDALPDPAWRDLVDVERDGATLAVALHPAEESLRCEVEGDRLRVTGRTNSAGPGYHAFVLDLLDRAGEACGLVWDPPEDLTASEDVPSLQAEAADWLREVARRISALAREGSGSLGVSLPEGTVLVDERRVASPLGLWEPSWFDETAALQGDALRRRAAEFYPWFGEGLDATAWARAGQVIAWVDLPWRAPRDDAETRRYQQARLCFARARTLDPEVALPPGVEDEVRRLLDARGRPLEAPAPDGVGFRRRVLRWALAGGWSIELPGFYTSTLERGGETKLIWFPGRTVRVSTFSMRVPDGSAPPAEHLLREVPEGAGPVATFERGHLRGQAVFLEEEEDGKRFFTLQGEVAAPGEVCVVTVSFTDMADRDWAIATWSSAFHPGPEA
ncbi:MAG: hypothetical protein KIT58_17655 [Planctomycetota bacterium]|nr:hypothetical protein [Planctomycetota bacterium]